jgi:hypothetical protein
VASAAEGRWLQATGIGLRDSGFRVQAGACDMTATALIFQLLDQLCNHSRRPSKWKGRLYEVAVFDRVMTPEETRDQGAGTKGQGPGFNEQEVAAWPEAVVEIRQHD